MLRVCVVVVVGVVSVAGCVGGGDGIADDDCLASAVSVVAFDVGEGAGFGGDRMPGVVFGAPHGITDKQGSEDVVSLGKGGAIVVEVGCAISDGAGVDFYVYENAFRYGADGTVFGEPAVVSVSSDGETFSEFPCEPQTNLDDGDDGCAGLAPILANADNGRVGTVEGGGDGFDLASIGADDVSFIRIVDSGVSVDFGGNTAGFDLDAVAVVNR